MKIELTRTYLTLTREPGDRPLRSENAVTHAIKTLLAEQGIKAIRPRGFVGLTSCKQVLRVDGPDGYYLWHERYQIEDAREAFNAGSVTYQRVALANRTEFGEQGAESEPDNKISPAVSQTMRNVAEMALRLAQRNGIELPEPPAYANRAAVIGHVQPLTPEEAYATASQWGSYMRDGDPGAVFYSFPAGRALVENEDHRADLLAYTDKCIAWLALRASTAEDAEMAADDVKDAADLARLRAYFATAPAQDAPVWWEGDYGVAFQLTRAQAAGASHQGRCDEDVSALRKDDALAAQLAKIDPSKLREELAEYGTWDAADLADHQANLDRIVWLAAGDILDGRCD